MTVVDVHGSRPELGIGQAERGCCRQPRNVATAAPSDAGSSTGTSPVADRQSRILRRPRGRIDIPTPAEPYLLRMPPPRTRPSRSATGATTHGSSPTQHHPHALQCRAADPRRPWRDERTRLRRRVQQRDYLLVTARHLTHRPRHHPEGATGLAMPGQRRIHMKKEGSARRSTIIETITSAGVRATIYNADHTGRHELTARAECIRAVVVDPAAQGTAF